MRARILALGLAALVCSPALSQGPAQGGAEVHLLTDSAIPRYLQRGHDLAKAKQWDRMVDVLQRVVEGDPAVFPDISAEVLQSAVYSEDGKIFFPAREFCIQELSRLPPEGLAAYRRAYDAKARELFRRAEAEPDLRRRLAAYASIYDLYLVSSVGDDALERAADIDLILGRFYEALGLLRRLIEHYPKDTDRDLPMAYARAAYCAARIGDLQLRNTLLSRLASEFPEARVELTGEQVPVTKLAENPRMAVRGVPAGAARDDWPIAGGNPARSAVAADLPPDIAKTPFWSFAISERDARLSAKSGSWKVRRHNREPTEAPSLSAGHFDPVRPYPAVRPVVRDGVVLYKDYAELVARRIGSGALVRLRWQDPGPPESLTDPTYLYGVDDVRPGSQLGGKETQRYELIYRYFDYGGNAVAVEGDQIFLADALHPASELTTVAPAKELWENLLAAYDSETGMTRWAWSLDIYSRAVGAIPALLERWNADFQRHSSPHFYGPGVPASGLLYSLAYEGVGSSGQVSLWAFDAVTGEVRFRTALHFRDEAQKRIPVGDSLSVAGGLVYAQTGSGVIAAVDALPPGRVRWIRRYPRNYQAARGGGRGGGRSTRIQIAQGFAYNDPLVYAGKLIVAPPDGFEVVALDAETGALAWTRRQEELGRPFQIVGAAHGVVVLAGERVVALDVATGKTRWGPRNHGGVMAFGRGFVGETKAYVPATLAPEQRSIIAAFDLESGERTLMTFQVPRLGNLVHAGGRLIAATDDTVMCFTSLERELREAAVDPESRLERARVLLRSDPPRRDEAREEFRRALAMEDAEPSPDPDLTARIREGAIRNLIAIARKRRDLGALDEADTIAAAMASALPGSHAPHPYQAQAALERIRVLAALGRGADALRSLDGFLDTYPASRVLDQEGHVVLAPIAADQVRETLLTSNVAFRKAFETGVRERIRVAVAEGNTSALAGMAKRYGRRHPSEEGYLALARLHEQRKETAQAILALEGFLRDFADNPRRGEVHLRLALLLARSGNRAEARQEYSAGISRLDENQRQALADLLAELEKRVASQGPPAPAPELRIPLARTSLLSDTAAPLRIRGALPEAARGLVFLAAAGEFVAVDGKGKLIWTVPTPGGDAGLPGSDQDPGVAVAAAAVHAARFTRVVGSDLILGGVGGVVRVDAASGELRWSYPKDRAAARKQARAAIAGLEEDLVALRHKGSLRRRTPLPRFLLAGDTVIRVHPAVGIEAIDAATGALRWQNLTVKGPLVGPPETRGQLLAVGWASTGLVQVYDLTGGDQPIATFQAPGAALAAPPVLDSFGRIYIIAGDELRILNAANLSPAFDRPLPTFSPMAMVLATDGRRVVFHDGSSVGDGAKNLHFLDLATGELTHRLGGDLLRDVSIARDGSRIFVFSRTLGREA